MMNSDGGAEGLSKNIEEPVKVKAHVAYDASRDLFALYVRVKDSCGNAWAIDPLKYRSVNNLDYTMATSDGGFTEDIVRSIVDAAYEAGIKPQGWLEMVKRYEKLLETYESMFKTVSSLADKLPK